MVLILDFGPRFMLYTFLFDCRQINTHIFTDLYELDKEIIQLNPMSVIHKGHRINGVRLTVSESLLAATMVDAEGETRTYLIVCCM